MSEVSFWFAIDLTFAPVPSMTTLMAASEAFDGLAAVRTISHEQAGWRRLTSFPALLGVALVTTVVIFANRSIADPDIWWHLRNAQELLRTGRFVRADAYSFTVRGAAWINHEWLGEIPYYLGWRFVGLRGLYLVMALALVAIFLLLYRLACLRSHDYKAAALACGLAIPLSTVSFGPRNLLFGWIYLLAELLILEMYEYKPRLLWLLPPLFVVWVNTHGSWLIGFVLLLAFAAAGCCNVRAGRIESAHRSIAELKQLAAVLATSAAALFLNPYGWRLVFYPFDLAFRQKLNVSHVQEWQSPDFHGVRGKMLLAILLGVLVLGLLRQGRMKFHELLYLLIAFYSAITYSRFLFLAAIMVTPVLASELSLRGVRRPAIADKNSLNFALMVAMTAIMVWQIPSNVRLSAGIAQEYPVAALGRLNAMAPQARVLNDYEWGGYLIWNAPQMPVFVDSRVDIFEYGGIFADYLDIMGVKNSLELLRKHKIGFVLYARGKPLSYLLRNASGWRVIYEDNVAVLFERTP